MVPRLSYKLFKSKNIISLKSDVKEGDKINIVVSNGDIVAEVK